MFCYEMRVPTINSTNEKFKMGSKYYPCIGGIVYVFADGVAGAAAQIPVATQITLMGPAYVESGEPS